MKCKHKECNQNRFWRLWAVGYCVKHAFENKINCEKKGVYR